MADFRKIFYAFAVVALLAAFSAPASAQGIICSQPSGTYAFVRQGGITEFTGDYVISCTAASPNNTVVGTAVKQATLRLKVLNGVKFTTKIASHPSSSLIGTSVTATTSGGTAPSLAMTESLLLVDDPAAAPANLQIPCVTTDSAGNLGVCTITYDGLPDNTYTGTNSSGRNIFQGRVSVNPGACPPDSCVEFLGVPLDPPSTTRSRVFRFKNNRIDASSLAAGTKIVFELSVADSQTAVSLPLEKKAEVAEVLASNPSTSVTPNTYVICVGQTSAAAGVIKITEGVQASTWRARNTVVQKDNSTNLAAYVANNFNSYGGTTTINTVDDPQDDPNGGYFTESSFVLSSAVPGYLSNGLPIAGTSGAGTILSFAWTPPTSGTVTWPATATLTSGSATTGSARLTSSLASGIISYEVGYTNPFALETMTILPTITYSATATVTSGAISDAVLSRYPAVSTLASFPRFITGPSGANKISVSIGPCQCNLLFPWVVSNSGFATGIAVSNTSTDPVNGSVTNGPVMGATGFVGPAKQAGVTRLYLFGSNSAGTAQAGSLDQTSVSVASGTSVAFLVSGISGGFQGYAITQSDFEYCHGVAYVVPTSGAATLSYLGLVMDNVNASQLPRTTATNTDRMDN